MATQTQATIEIPLDIPNVKVQYTEVHPDGKLLIWVESEVETVPCGLCGREVRATASPACVGNGDIHLL